MSEVKPSPMRPPATGCSAAGAGGAGATEHETETSSVTRTTTTDRRIEPSSQRPPSRPITNTPAASERIDARETSSRDERQYRSFPCSLRTSSFIRDEGELLPGLG